MINHIPMSEARVNLCAVVKRVYLKGEYFILEKDGIPVAGLLAVEELEDYLEPRDPKAIKQIAESTKDYKAGRVRSARGLIDELNSALVAKGKRGAKNSAKTT